MLLDNPLPNCHYPCMDPEGGQGVWTPAKNHQKRGFRSNSGPDPLTNHKATEPAFNVGPSSARQPIVAFRSPFPSSIKKLKQKKPVKVGAPLTKISVSACHRRIHSRKSRSTAPITCHVKSFECFN